MLWLGSIALFATFSIASLHSGLGPVFTPNLRIVEEFTEESMPIELERMKAAVKEADYIAFDNELGGFINNRAAAHDSPAAYYRKVADSVEKYSLLQFGFTTVKQRGNGCFEEQTWSIYVLDDVVTVNPASGSFLLEAKFDWNRLYQSRFGIRSGRYPFAEFMRNTFLAARKPLICHNCLADLVHIMKYFTDYSVPQDLEQFTQAARSSFSFFDTKVMFVDRWPNSRNPETNLSACYKSFQGPDVGAAHGAGVDSLMTARLFAYLAGNRPMSQLSLFQNTLMLDLSRFYNLNNGTCGYFQRSHQPSHLFAPTLHNHPYDCVEVGQQQLPKGDDQ